jgi:hypothetical protein
MKAEAEVARGNTANISRTGAYFRSESAASLKPGQTVSVRIGMPSGKDASGCIISGSAHVVRLDEAQEGCGIALHFSEELDGLPEAGRGKT